jgi:hypothetical protein
MPPKKSAKKTTLRTLFKKAATKKVPTKSANSFNARWHPALQKDGFAQVSVFFLKNYHRLKPYDLTYGEAMFVVHLMQYKWTSDAPFPSYKTISTQMNVSIKSARRFAQQLQGKGYLHREMRVGKTNRFHLTKLMEALVVLRTAQLAEQRKLKAGRINEEE